MSSKSVLQECQVRSVLQVSHKSVKQELLNSVKQGCHLSVWTQDVSQVSLLEMWQISIVSVCQHTCLHSGSWASSCFFEGHCVIMVESPPFLISQAGLGSVGAALGFLLWKAAEKILPSEGDVLSDQRRPDLSVRTFRKNWQFVKMPFFWSFVNIRCQCPEIRVVFGTVFGSISRLVVWSTFYCSTAWYKHFNWNFWTNIWTHFSHGWFQMA